MDPRALIAAALGVVLIVLGLVILWLVARTIDHFWWED